MTNDPLQILPFLIGIIGLVLFLILSFYLYWAFAFYTIAKKLGYDKPWLAFIPVANAFLLPILAEKEWTWGFLLLVPIANLVFSILWTWRVYERRNYPGWLSLVALGSFIPMLWYVAGIANLVILGFVAWRDQ